MTTPQFVTVYVNVLVTTNFEHVNVFFVKQKSSISNNTIVWVELLYTIASYTIMFYSESYVVIACKVPLICIIMLTVYV